MGAAGDNTGQRSSGQKTLPSGTSDHELFSWRSGESEPPRQLRLSLSDTSEPCVFTLTRRWLDHDTTTTLDLGPGGAVVLPLSGAVDVAVDAPAGAVVRWGVQRVPEAAPWPGLVDVSVSLPAGLGGPGVWVDVGWAPPEKHGLCIYTEGGAVDLRWVNGAGVARAQFTVAGFAAGLVHPPSLKLQARHPTQTDTRAIVAVWSRGT